MATPARHRAPPVSPSAVGTSPSVTHDTSTAMPGTHSVVAAMRPASVLAKAYAHVVNAIAVGPTPRNTTPTIAPPETWDSSTTACGANGSVATRPAAQPTQVAVTASTERSATFCISTPAA